MAPLSAAGRVAAGDARMASASPVSASPTLNPLSRSVRAKPASFCRMAAPSVSSAFAIAAAIGSRHLAEQPLGHLAGDAGAVLVGLEQAHHGVVHGLGLVAQVVGAEAGERGGPIERLGHARHLAQIL